MCESNFCTSAVNAVDGIYEASTEVAAGSAIVEFLFDVLVS